MNDRKTRIIFVTAVAVIAVSAFAVSLYQFTVGSGCVFLTVTGIPCPTCGMTRATLALVFGSFTEAFGYHPLFWAPYTMIAMGIGCAASRRLRRLFLICIASLFIAFIAVWVIRVTCFEWRG